MMATTTTITTTVVLGSYVSVPGGDNEQDHEGGLEIIADPAAVRPSLPMATQVRERRRRESGRNHDSWHSYLCALFLSLTFTISCPFTGPAVKRACAGLPGDCSLCVCAVPWIVVCASRRGVAISSLVTKNVRVPLSPLSITFNDVHCISKLPPPPFMIKLRLTSYLMVRD